jgi:hypothetical protein
MPSMRWQGRCWSSTASSANINLGFFIVSAIVARGARFFLLARLLRRFGEEIRDFLERRLSTLAGGAAAILICLFAAHRLFY